LAFGTEEQGKVEGRKRRIRYLSEAGARKDIKFLTLCSTFKHEVHLALGGLDYQLSR